jgi:arylsulfatase A-like enzyme
MKLIAIILLLVASTSLNAQERRPNIILMYTDDQPQNCLGIMGNSHIRTPNLDRLAQRGTLFNNAFVIAIELVY